MKRSIALAAALAAGGLALAGSVTPAGAGTGSVPGNSGACGANSGYLSACVTVSNETRGFSGPGQTSRGTGLAFVGGDLHTKATAGTATAKWTLGGGSKAPVSGWLAAQCRSDTYSFNGCDLYFNTTLAANPDVAAANRTLQTAIVVESGNRPVTFHAWQHAKKKFENGHTCSSGNPFVRCLYINESGISKHPRFNYRLTTETVTVKITNFIDQRLVLTGNPSWGGLVPDARGESPTGARLPNQQLNSARSIAPYLDGGSLPQAYWGALRPVDEQSTLLLAYRYEHSSDREGTTYTDNTVTLRLEIDTSGRADGTTCEVASRSTFTRALCTIEGMSYSGNNTEVSISLAE